MRGSLRRQPSASSAASSAIFRSISLAVFLMFTVSPLNGVQAQTQDAEGVPQVKKKKKIIGMTTNGGGVVAATAGATIMGAFQQRPITKTMNETTTTRPAMEAFDFVTGMSGGNIIVALYGYSQTSNSDQLLDVAVTRSTVDIDGDGEYRTDPSKITPRALKRKPSRKSFLRVATRSMVLKFLPVAGWGIFNKKRQSVWALAIWWVFLKPFGIPRNHVFGSKEEKENHKYMIVTREDAHAVPLVNFLLVGEVDDGGRCFTDGWERYQDYEKGVKKSSDEVSNPSQVAEALADIDNVTFIPFTASPEHLFTGFSLDIKTTDGRVLKPAKPVKPSEFGATAAKKRSRFSLELLLGAATDLIPYERLKASQKPELTPAESDKILSGGNAFAVERAVTFGNNVTKNMLFADGGTLYGPGIQTLVKEGANTLFVPMWLTGASNQYSVVYNKTKGQSLRAWLDIMWWGANTDSFGVIAPPSPGMNHIFDNGLVHMQTLREAFDALYRADKPLITTLKNVKVIDNPYFGIKGEGRVVDITFLYVTMPRKFALAVPAKSVPPPRGVSDTVDELGRFTNADFRDFPNFDTFNHQDEFEKTPIFRIFKKIRLGLSIGSLSTRQANMMVYLANYLINEAWDGVSFDGKEYFAGFDDFFADQSS